MILSATARLLIIVSLSIATIAVSVKVVASPAPPRSLLPVVLPTTIRDWQTVVLPPDSALPNTVRYRRNALELELQFIPDLTTHYVYNPQLELRFLPRGHLPLDAALHFYISPRDGIITNLSSDRPLNAKVEHRRTDPSAAYGLWTADQRQHLSAIITPNGDSGIATRQVARSLHLAPLSPRLIGDWVLGKTALPDRRCVLVHLSAPADVTAEKTNLALEEAWTNWRASCRLVFPPQ